MTSARVHRTFSTFALMRKMLVSVVLALAAFAVTFRGVSDVAELEALPAVLAAGGVALLVAAIAMLRTISPIVAVQADLQVRYETAVADALKDPLTSLGNHRSFQEELDRQVEASLRYGIPLSLMLIDLDEFKQVNDSKGHAGGDRVLRGFGRLLEGSLRRADRAFRVGGDEFAVLLPHTDLENAHVVGRRLLAQALQPSMRHEDLSPVSFSGGISAMPEMADSRTQLFSQADSALYAAKRKGRTEVVAFDASLRTEDAGVPEATSAAIADVIARNQLRPVYQPIVELATGTVIGVEGLIRPVPPAPFTNPGELFAAAEASGRLTALDLACVDAILVGASALPRDQFLSINLTPSTIEAPEFSSGTLLGILARRSFPPARLVIELTENQAIHDVDRVRERIEACQRAGVRFAADDVGAGNAGLRLLSEIRFDIIKLDLGLVQKSASGGPSSAVLESVASLAAGMGALIIAEGIEQASQLPPLSAMGIQAGQGYHLGHPGPLEEVVPAAAPEPIGISAWRQSIGLPSPS
jgi:diguanylate cyclase (GGDEF)-like protein